jgi:DNA-binding response OmpR family regulator
MKANNMPTDILPVGKIRVLVVDSENGSKSPVIDTLATRGYEVQGVSNGFDAGAAAHKFAPHVILINLLARDIDAHGICKSIRTSEEYGTIKIVALANQLSPQEAAALMQKGFDGYVSNPTDVTEIVKRIEEATAIIY